MSYLISYTYVLILYIAEAAVIRAALGIFLAEYGLTPPGFWSMLALVFAVNFAAFVIREAAKEARQR